jgi:hypothetical protein
MAVVIAVAVLAPASAFAAPQVFVKSSIDNESFEVKPHRIILAGDGTLALLAIKYESYGGPVAKGTSTAYTRGCTPFCADGEVLRPKATLRLSDLIKCEGKMIYAELSYRLYGKIPKGFSRRVTDDMRPVGAGGKPAC